MVYRFIIPLSAIIALALACSASAQIQNPGVVQVGPVVPGNCVQWVAKNKVKDSGAPCGSGPVGCTGAADASAGCPLPMLGT